MVFQEDGEEIVIDVEADYDSKIDRKSQTETEDDSSSQFSEEEELLTSRNNNATVEDSSKDSGKSKQMFSDEDLWNEFQRLKGMMEEKGLLGSDCGNEKSTRADEPRGKKGKGKKDLNMSGKEIDYPCGSGSQSMIYKRAVKRGSSSSEDNNGKIVDTSDEMEIGMEANLIEVDSEINFVVGRRKHQQHRDDRQRQVENDRIDAHPGCSYRENPQQKAARHYEDEIDECLNKVIRDAEALKARINQIKGRISELTQDWGRGNLTILADVKEMMMITQFWEDIWIKTCETKLLTMNM